MRKSKYKNKVLNTLCTKNYFLSCNYSNTESHDGLWPNGLISKSLSFQEEFELKRREQFNSDIWINYHRIGIVGSWNDIKYVANTISFLPA